MSTANVAGSRSIADSVTLPQAQAPEPGASIELSARSSLFNRSKLPVAVLSDGGGGVRNAVCAANSGLAASRALACASVASGAIGIVSATQLIHSGVGIIRNARRIGDGEGLAQGVLLTAAGTTFLGGATSFVVSKAATLQGHASLATSAMMWGALPLYGAMNVFFLGVGAYRYTQASRFYGECLFRLNDENRSERENLDSFLTFLKEEIDIPANTPSFQIAIEVEKRRALLERKVGAEHANRIISDLEGIIKRFPTSDMTEARTLAYETRKACYRTLFHNALLILTAIVGIAAVVASFVCPFGFILFAVAGAVWVAYDMRGVSDRLADIFWDLTFEDLPPRISGTRAPLLAAST